MVVADNTSLLMCVWELPHMTSPWPQTVHLVISFCVVCRRTGQKKIIQRGLTTFARLSIVQNMLNSSYFINNLLKTICTVINMLE